MKIVEVHGSKVNLDAFTHFVKTSDTMINHGVSETEYAVLCCAFDQGKKISFKTEQERDKFWDEVIK